MKFLFFGARRFGGAWGAVAAVLLGLPAARGGEEIAYVKAEKEVENVRVVGADGTGDRAVTKFDSRMQVGSLAFSPDGKKIAFTGSPMMGMDAEIFVADVETGEARNLTEGKLGGAMASAGQPAWSPDGKRIAFTAGEMMRKAIHAMDADGSNFKKLTDRKAHEHSPVFSPDGKRIAFVSQDRKTEGGGTTLDQPEIWAMNPDGADPKNLSANEGEDAAPSWSPDSRRVLFVNHPIERREGNVTVLGQPEILAAEADGSGVKNLTDDKHEDRDPSWSPDGRRIAFIARKEGGPNTIYTMDAEGKDLKGLIEPAWGPEYFAPVFSPDGLKLLFRKDQAICVMGADGSGVKEIASGKEAAWRPAEKK